MARSQLCVLGGISADPVLGKARGIPCGWRNILKVRMHPSSLGRVITEGCLSVWFSGRLAVPFICPLKIIFAL